MIKNIINIIWILTFVGVIIIGMAVATAVINHVYGIKPTEPPKEVSRCMTPQEVETAVYELKNEIIERDEYHPALKVPARKPEVK